MRRLLAGDPRFAAHTGERSQQRRIFRVYPEIVDRQILLCKGHLTEAELLILEEQALGTSVKGIYFPLPNLRSFVVAAGALYDLDEWRCRIAFVGPWIKNELLMMIVTREHDIDLLVLDDRFYIFPEVLLLVLLIHTVLTAGMKRMMAGQDAPAGIFDIFVVRFPDPPPDVITSVRSLQNEAAVIGDDLEPFRQPRNLVNMVRQ